MKCIVPLAGPDLHSAEFGLRPLFLWNNKPLLAHVLNGRRWRPKLDPSDYIFVLRTVPDIEILREFIAHHWPGSSTVIISDLSKGALFSCLAGISLVSPQEALIIDLADIAFSEGPEDPESDMKGSCEALVPCFTSRESCFSYLRFDRDVLKEAAEKRVISELASAGVYMFATTEVFLSCAAWSMAHYSEVSVGDVLFVCPAINALVGKHGAVKAPIVNDPVAIGKIFHR